MYDKIFKKYARVVLACAVVATISTAEADNPRGADLYENHCQACHTADVHTREHRLSSRVILRAWVDAWSRHVNLGWSAADIDDVTDYLDDRFYHF